ncbi:MAG: hypothetical protein ACLFPL_05110 [Candidatus Nanoarchaeia archaeon]
MFQKIFLLALIFIVPIFSVYADTNGVWTYTEKIEAGVFGANQNNFVESNYTFNDIVNFNQDLFYKSLLLEDMFVNTN